MSEISLRTESFEVMKNVMNLYRLHRAECRKWQTEADRYNDLLNEEMMGKGINPQASGSDVGYAPTPYEVELIHCGSAAEMEAVRHQKLYETLDVLYQITPRFKKLNTEYQIIINAIFFNNLSYAELASDEEISKQAIGGKVSNAIRKMAEMRAENV